MTMRPRGSLGEIDWAYCGECNRDVELRSNGRLAPHVTHKGAGYSTETCKGSLHKPWQRPEESWGDDGST